MIQAEYIDESLIFSEFPDTKYNFLLICQYELSFLCEVIVGKN